MTEELLIAVADYYNTLSELKSKVKGGAHLYEAPAEAISPCLVISPGREERFYAFGDKKFANIDVIITIYSKSPSTREIYELSKIIKELYHKPDIEVSGHNLTKFILTAVEPLDRDNEQWWFISITFSSTIEEV